MENRPESREVETGASETVEYSKCARIRGALLKAGFYALLTLMSCGTLLIILYTFIGRGFIG